MKTKLSKIYSVVTAVAVTIGALIELINRIQMWSITLNHEQFAISWKANASWEFLPSMWGWIVRILAILSVLFLIFCWEKPKKPNAK